MNNKKRKISTISEIKKRIQKFNNVESNQKPNYWIYVFRLSSEDLIFVLDQIMIYYPWISVDQKLFLKHFKEYKSKYVLLGTREQFDKIEKAPNWTGKETIIKFLDDGTYLVWGERNKK